MTSRDREQALVPNDVVNMIIDREWTPMRAWREHLGLMQAERAGISQAAYAQLENSAKHRPATLKNIAAALGLSREQLAF